MLFEFIVTNRAEIIRRCRAKVATRSMPPPTDEEIDCGVPVFLDSAREINPPLPPSRLSKANGSASSRTNRGT